VDASVLTRIKILTGLSDAHLHSFLQYMEILSLETGSYAVRQGEESDALYLILEGELRARVCVDGQETILATLNAGGFFGEISLLDQGPRSADVVANERSTLLKFSAAAYAKLRREAPALAEPFLYALSQTIVGRFRLLTKRYQDSVLMLQTLQET